MNKRSILIEPDDIATGPIYVDEPEMQPLPAGVLPPEHPLWDKIEEWHRKNGYTNTASSPFDKAQTAEQLESLVQQSWTKLIASLAGGLSIGPADVEKIREKVEQLRPGYRTETLTGGQIHTINRMKAYGIAIPDEDYDLVIALHYVLSRSIINQHKSPPADMVPVLAQYYAAYKETFDESLGESISPETVAKLTGKSP